MAEVLMTKETFALGFSMSKLGACLCEDRAIGDEGAKMMGKMLQTSRTVEYLNLNGE